GNPGLLAVPRSGPRVLRNERLDIVRDRSTRRAHTVVEKTHRGVWRPEGYRRPDRAHLESGSVAGRIPGRGRIVLGIDSVARSEAPYRESVVWGRSARSYLTGWRRGCVADYVRPGDFPSGDRCS